MQVLVHIPVLDCIAGRFLSGVDGCIEVLQLASEAHTDFEGICHDEDDDGIGRGFEVELATSADDLNCSLLVRS